MKLEPIDISGGVNLLKDRRQVAENECVRAQNFAPTKSGMGAKRLPRGILRDSSGEATRVGGLFPLSLYCPDVPGVDFFETSRRINQSSLGVLNAFTFQGTGPGLLATATYSEPFPRRPGVAVLNKKLYATPGYPLQGKGLTSAGVILDSGAILQEKIGGGGVEFVSLTFSTPQSPAVAPALCAVYRNRMVYANFGPGKEDWLVFSDRNTPTLISQDALAANGRNFRLGGTFGRCTALREVMLTSTGTPTETMLLAFKERAMYLIQGEPGQTTDTAPGPSNPPTTILGNLTVQRVNTDAGCASQETITQTPYGIFWAGPDDVWFMAQGQSPIRVGSKIRPILEASPASVRYLWHAVYFNGFYRLSVFTEGQGPDDDSPLGEQWWLDLRDGAPQDAASARWWGPQIYKAVPGGDDIPAYTPWAPSTLYGVGVFVSNGSQIYISTVGGTSAASGGPSGTGTGIVDGTVTWDRVSGLPSPLTGVRMQAIDQRDGRESGLYSIEPNNDSSNFIYSYDVPSYSGRDGAATVEAGVPFPGEPDYLAMDGSEIEVDIHTAEVDFGDPGVDKGYDGTEVTLAASEAVQMQVRTDFDGGRRVLTASEPLAQSDSFTLDVSTLDSALFTREFKAQNVRPPSGTRATGKTIQHRIGDLPGYIIDASNDNIGLGIQAIEAGVTVQYWTLSIPHGFYATITDLVNALTAQVAAVTAVTLGGIFYESFMASNQAVFVVDHYERTSALANFQIIPNGGYTLNAWIIHFLVDPAGSTLDPVKQKLGAMLGFDTSLQGVVSLTDTITAVTPIFNKRVAHFELASMIDSINLYRRRSP